MTQNDTSKYYKTILETINTKDFEKENVYQELLNVEKNVLETVKRVTEHEQTKKHSKLIDKSVIEHIYLFSNTWKNIIIEIFVEKQYKTLKEIFMNNDRKVYVGIMFIVIALVFFAESK